MPIDTSPSSPPQRKITAPIFGEAACRNGGGLARFRHGRP